MIRQLFSMLKGDGVNPGLANRFNTLDSKIEDVLTSQKQLHEDVKRMEKRIDALEKLRDKYKQPDVREREKEKIKQVGKWGSVITALTAAAWALWELINT